MEIIIFFLGWKKLALALEEQNGIVVGPGSSVDFAVWGLGQAT